jgi:hypothetical protein
MLIAGIKFYAGFEPKNMSSIISGNGTNTNNHYHPDRTNVKPLVLYLKKHSDPSGYCSYE